MKSVVEHKHYGKCLYSTTDFLMMDFHGPKHVEKIFYNSVISRVHLVGYNCNEVCVFVCMSVCLCVLLRTGRVQ